MPLPLPLAPEVTVSQLSLLAAVQAHPVGEETETLPVVTPAPADWLVGESVYVQAAPPWVTVKVWPPAVRVPVREVDAV